MPEEFDNVSQRPGEYKPSADRLDEIRNEQNQKMDETRLHLSQIISSQFEQLRQHRAQHVDLIQQSSVGKHVENADAEKEHSSKLVEEHATRADSLGAKHQEAVARQRDAEQEAAKLREQIAAAEARAKAAEQRQQTMADLKTQLEGIRQDNIQALDAHHGIVKNHIINVVVEHSVKRVEEHGARLDSYKSARENAVQCKRRVEIEGAGMVTRLKTAEEQAQSLQVEVDTGLQREVLLKAQLEHDLSIARDEHEEAKIREAELMHMLSEVQDNIITASATGGETPATPFAPPSRFF